MDQSRNRAPFRNSKSHQRIIDRFALGEGDHQHDPHYEVIEKDPEAFRLDRLQHVRDHVDMWAMGDRRDDHLAAVAWWALVMMHHEEKMKP